MDVVAALVDDLPDDFDELEADELEDFEEEDCDDEDEEVLEDLVELELEDLLLDLPPPPPESTLTPIPWRKVTSLSLIHI